jgi:hypothetical protein
MNTEQVIIQASQQSEEYLKNRVRDRLAMKPKLGGFLSAMGSHFFSFVNDEIDDRGLAPRTEDILREFDLHLDSFGSFPWRVDLIDGKYVERTDW